MNISIFKATLTHLNSAEQLVKEFHAFENIISDRSKRLKALEPILSNSPLGEFFLIQTAQDHIGYIFISYSWSLEFGGKDAMLDEIFIKAAYQGQGVGKSALKRVHDYLKENETIAISLEVSHENNNAQQFYDSLGYKSRDKYSLMS